MIFPTLHLNGTSGPMLIEGYKDAVRAVNAAIDAMAKIEFNGRDYYPQGDDAFRQARKEHAARFEALNQVQAELIKIAMSVHDQQAERDEMRRAHS